MSTDEEEQSAAERTLLPAAAAWIALILSIGYATFLHQGLGAPPGGFPSEWWHPTQYLLLSPTVGGWADIPVSGTLRLGVPAALLALVVFLGTRSSTARALSLTVFISSVAFSYVGLAIEGLWEFFQWRLSLVLVWIGLALGFALQAPALARAWLRRSPAIQALLYLPTAFLVIAVIRNATGTDESLFSNFSPWPIIPVFGLEIGAYTIVGALVAMSIGVGALTQVGKRSAVVVAGILVAILFPAIWLSARFPIAESGVLAGIALVSAIVVALASITRGGNRHAKLVSRAGHLALGVALVAMPLFTGRAWANADYTLNKFVRAKIATQALAARYEKEGLYPDRLDTLIEEGYLDAIPRPRVGFDFLYDVNFLEPIEFSYRGLGSSYVLEFVSTEWIQCAYNPPWDPTAEYFGDEEYDEDDEELAEEDDESGEAWSCPDTRPALWGNEETRGEDEYDDWADEEEEE